MKEKEKENIKLEKKLFWEQRKEIHKQGSDANWEERKRDWRCYDKEKKEL